MSTSEQTTRKNSEASGVAGILRNSFQAGLGVAEKMHQLAVEIPLNMVPDAVASEEQTTALKDKHRNLLRSMYGSIDSITTKAIDTGSEQASRFVEGISKMAEDLEDEDDPVDTDKVVATVASKTSSDS